MNRAEFALTLRQLDLSRSPEEARHRERMLALLELRPDCFVRSCFPAHFTGSALVVSHDGKQVLLNHHRTLNRWQQFGGHCDGDEDVLRVAQREAWEESGVEGLIVASPKPFDLDIHEIPANAKKQEPVHFHFDVRYMLIAPEGAKFKVSDESHELRWVTADEMRVLCSADAGILRLIDKWQQRNAAPSYAKR
jgi:8-oxo-dGTP pyrophosphatase MutT (NUDIX family)